MGDKHNQKLSGFYGAGDAARGRGWGGLALRKPVRPTPLTKNTKPCFQVPWNLVCVCVCVCQKTGSGANPKNSQDIQYQELNLE